LKTKPKKIFAIDDEANADDYMSFDDSSVVGYSTSATAAILNDGGNNIESIISR